MKRILYVVNNLDYFLSHRGCLAEAAQAEGYKVCVATPDQEGDQKLRARGWEHFNLTLSRSGLRPDQELKTLWALYRLIKMISPDLLHLVTIKPVIYGGLIGRFFPKIALVSAIPGLGYVFTGKQLRRRILRFFVGIMYRIALSGGKHRVIFQNRDDMSFFIKQKWIKPAQAALILGAGVNPADYPYLPEPASKQITIVLPARLLKDKGVGEFVEAARQLSNKADFVLVGDIDKGNPASYALDEVRHWVSEGVISWWGWRMDMLDVFNQCHIVCLPSYREGLPRVLVEAASCGRPIVTTDVPGCREVVEDDLNGLLVPMGAIDPLVEALAKLINDAQLRKSLGKKGREKVIHSLSEAIVVEKTMSIYRKHQK